MSSRTFDSFAGGCAFGAAVATLAHTALLAAVVRADEAEGLVPVDALLLAAGLLTMPVVVAVYLRVRETDPGFALLAAVLGVAGALGSAVHGGYDLALDVRAPERFVALPASAIDPRGLLTFALAGLAIATFSWLFVRGGAFPAALGRLGFAAAALLLAVYLAWLVVLDPGSPVVIGAAGLAGLVARPAWLAWVGLELRRQPRERTPPLATAPSPSTGTG